MPTTLKWANSKTRPASSSYGMLTGSVIFGLVQASLFLESSSISFIFGRRILWVCHFQNAHIQKWLYIE